MPKRKNYWAYNQNNKRTEYVLYKMWKRNQEWHKLFL